LLSVREWARGTFRPVDRDHQQKLESVSDSIDSAFLQTNPNLFGEPRGSRKPEAQEINTSFFKAGRNEPSSDGEGLMPLTAIKPNSHLKLRYPIDRRRRIEYEVEANLPVTTFILDEEGLQEYNSRGSDVYSYYGGFSHRRVHREKVELPSDFDGPLYLIIQNDDEKQPVAVRYEVFA
jgi:hypothetical protein